MVMWKNYAHTHTDTRLVLFLLMLEAIRTNVPYLWIQY